MTLRARSRSLKRPQLSRVYKWRAIFCLLVSSLVFFLFLSSYVVAIRNAPSHTVDRSGRSVFNHYLIVIIPFIPWTVKMGIGWCPLSMAGAAAGSSNEPIRRASSIRSILLGGAHNTVKVCEVTLQMESSLQVRNNHLVEPFFKLNSLERLNRQRRDSFVVLFRKRKKKNWVGRKNK